MSKPKLSVILVSYNTKDITLQSLASVIQSHGFKTGEIEIIVVDNHSSDGTVAKLSKRYPEVKLIVNQKNLGFGAGNNQGVKAAQSEYLLLLNTDAFLSPDTLSFLLAELHADQTLLAIAPKLTYPNGQVQQSCGYFPTLGRLTGWMLWLDKIPLLKTLFPTPYHYYDLSRYRRDLTPDWLMGACLLLRKADFEAVHGFDTQIFMYGEEVELFLRLKAKFPNKIVKLTTKTSVVHLGSVSSSNAGTTRLLHEFEGIIKLYHKHYPSLVLPARLVISLGVLLRILIFSFIPSRSASAREYLRYFGKALN